MKENGPVTVFLGAGASASVGVPESKGLAEEIEQNCPIYIDRIRELRDRIKAFGFSYDVEALLSVLEFWSAPRNVITETGAFFAEVSRRKSLNSFRKHRNDARIKNRAKEIIVQNCFINDAPRIRNIKLRFAPFFKELHDAFDLPDCSPAGTKPCPPIDVFTTNYDNVIEQYCQSNGMTYCDGYVEPVGRKRHAFVFDKRCYSESQSILRLYKLHGTVTYVRQADGELVNLPLYNGGQLIIRGKPAVFDLIYPGTYRYGTREPQFELFSLLKEKLSSCTCCITVGYSFRDPNISHIFHDVLAARMRYGSEIRSFLVSPDAKTVIRELGFDNLGMLALDKKFEHLKVKKDIWRRMQ